MNKGNLVISANDATIWIDEEVLATCTKASGKLTKESEEQKFVGDPKTYKRSKGYKIEGSVTIKKVDTYLAGKVADAIKANKELDSKMIVKQAAPGGGVERIALYGVDISELNLFNLEAGGAVEQEFPYTATDFEYLDRIAKIDVQ
jgi:hypothetical protein